MRYLVYLLTLFFIGTAIAQSPTIVQGDYITNVFGPSNFVKNPNAQINTANVTVSNATVTRATTTPLVAKSEFTITTSTATGYADWDLRTFDAGMKNNNCEARFTYRGFTVGSTKAQILQGANVVAELTLIGDANNPKQASINFPCGDLSAVTKFRLQQATASLTGTNEIGGIYVGLATNMANVAQAENVVQASKNSVQAFTSNVGSAVIFNLESKDVYGEFDTTNGRFTAKRAGDYLIQSTILSDYYSWAASNASEIQIRKNNGIICRVFKQIQATQTINLDNQITCVVTLAVGDYIETFWDQNRGTTNVNTNPSYTYTSISRFPSSSELVVKPETQNVFASVKGVGNGGITAVTAASWTPITFLSTVTRTNFGKAKVETTNDARITIDNMPVGDYYISTTGTYYAVANGNGDQTSCLFALADSGSGGAQIASMQVEATGDASVPGQGAFGSTIGGVYRNTSVGTRTFYVQTYRNSGVGGCYSFTNSNRPFTITVIPLDQPTNSALYVQGPVLGAQTGAAIPAGYVGQVISETVFGVVNLVNGWNTLKSFTLPVGVWNCSGGASILRNLATINAPNVTVGFSDSNTGSGPSNSDFYETNGGRLFLPTNNFFDQYALSIRPMVIRSTGSQIIFPYSTISGSTVWIQSYVGTVASGTPQARWTYECVRLN